MSLVRIVGAVVGSLVLVGCSSAPDAKGADGAASGEKAAVPASQLGHFASADGFVGFVFDRSGEASKFRLDKSTDVVELFLEEALDRGNKVGHFFNGPDGRAWLFVGTNGEHLYFPPEKRRALTAREVDQIGVRVSRDSDGELLGAASQKGVAALPAEKTPYDLASEKLNAISVVKKFPSFKPEDSGNLAKVSELIAQLDPSMVVRVSANGAAKAAWAPASNYIGDTNQGLGGRVSGYPSEQAWSKDAKGFAKWGGLLADEPMYGRPSRLRTQTLKGWPAPFAAGTPGVVWMTDGTTVVFVSLDGGRYHLELSGNPDQDGTPIDVGGGSVSAWPTPIQHALINVETVRGFAKGKAIPEQQGKDMEALDDGYWACVNKVWEEGKKEETAIETGAGGADAKSGKMAAIPKKFEAKAKKDCDGARKKVEDALVSFIDARNKERLVVYEKAKARAAAIGLK